MNIREEKKNSHRQVLCKKRVGISAGNYCIWFGISRQRTLRPCRKSTGFSGDFKEGTVQHSQVLHAKGSRPASSNIIQEHTGQVWGHCKQAKKEKNHPTTQAVTWHWTLLNCTLQTRISAYSATGGMSSRGKTKYKRPRRCTSEKETFVPPITPDLKPPL